MRFKKLTQFVNLFYKKAYISRDKLKECLSDVDVLKNIFSCFDIHEFDEKTKNLDINDESQKILLEKQAYLINNYFITQIQDIVNYIKKIFKLMHFNSSAVSIEFNNKDKYMIYLQEVTNKESIINHSNKIARIGANCSQHISFNILKSAIEGIFEEEEPQKYLNQFIEAMITIIEFLKNICDELGLKLNISKILYSLRYDENILLRKYPSESKISQEEIDDLMEGYNEI